MADKGQQRGSHFTARELQIYSVLAVVDRRIDSCLSSEALSCPTQSRIQNPEQAAFRAAHPQPSRPIAHFFPFRLPFQTRSIPLHGIVLTFKDSKGNVPKTVEANKGDMMIRRDRSGDVNCATRHKHKHTSAYFRDTK